VTGIARPRVWIGLGLAGLLLVGAAVTLDRVFPPELARLGVAGSEIVDRDGRLLAVRPAPGGVWRLRASVADVSPAFLNTLIATEDRRFWWHPGVDPLALARALLRDARAGRVVSGGSTLTMQVARLLHPRRRTLAAKLIEAARAIQLEWHLSKPEILSAWLTLAPFGGNLEGVRVGALAWCGVEARALDPVRSALLVGLPRRPEALRPDRHPARAAALRDRILAGLGWTGAVPPLSPRVKLPRGGPVLAGLPPAPRTVTTLDQPLQAALQRLLGAAIGRLPERVSAAVLIADAGGREIRAIVSGDGAAADEGRAGSLDLTRAIRSPGSALKPFIYGIAFQDGLLGPETPVDDAPRRFGGYGPENFDRGFAGRVTAAEALRRSLNLPAVALLDRVGPVRFAALLAGAGVPLKLPAGADPSLPLALGGAGVSMRGLGALYAALATDGAVTPLRLTGAAVPARPLLTPGAAAMVADALTQPMPDFGPSGLAWKTGTSWGGRDAWAAGFDQRHVLIAWVGRPDGTPLPAATGRALALPLLAEAYALLPPSPRPDPPPPVVVAEAVAPPGRDLRLLFPPPDAELSGDGPIVLRAIGGRRPLSFLVDGARLDADPARRQAAWVPSGPGFYRLTVLDADGAVARAAVRVR
jgi:penicillin-binding protein 1C